jgi:uncharacterized protein YkwD
MKFILIIIAQIAFCSSLYSQAIYQIEPNVASCQEGELTQQEKLRILDLVNRLRTMHNIPPVTYDYAGDIYAQKGALITVANAALSHQPPSNWSCYSQQGYVGNDKSNLFISMGSGNHNPNSELSLISWMIDESIENLGHRRAIMNPFVDKISFGRVDGTVQGWRTVGMNLKYLDNLGGNITNSNIEYVAYPQGNYDKNYFMNNWYLSFHVISDKVNWWNNNKITYNNATITMKDSRGNSVNVHSIGFDNEGWGALSNQIKWKCGNLTNYEEYTVEIKNVVFNGSSKDYTYKFTLGDGPAGAVPNATLIEPLNNAQNVRLNQQFSWQYDSQYEYQFQLSNEQNFSNLLDNVTIASNSFVSSKLENDKTYYWRVRVKLGNAFGDWSEVRTFNTESYSPEVPYIVYPLNTTNTLRIKPIFKWESSSQNLKFHLQVGDRPTFSLRLVDQDNIEGTEFNTINSSLKPATTYYLRIRAKDGNMYGSWSETIEFTTGEIPEGTQLLMPVNNGVVVKEEDWTFSWERENRTSEYILTIYSFNVELQTIDSLKIETENTSYVVKESEYEKRNSFTSWNIATYNSGILGGVSDTWIFEPRDLASAKLNVEEDVMIYPNPSVNYFNLEVLNSNFLNSNIKLYDIKGNIVKQEVLDESRKTIMIDDLGAGMYILILEQGSKFYFCKIIKN